MPATYLPLIHIGYHKTATTWLQTHFFGKCIPYLTSKQALKEEIFYTSSFEPLNIQNRYADFPHPVATISYERIIGDPYPEGQQPDGFQLAERMHKVFPNAKILVTIREQRSYLLSLYQQYIRMRGTCSLPNFLNDENVRSTAKFHPLISTYFDLFGEDNVLVLPFEYFREDGPAFIEDILEFVGMDRQQAKQLPYKERVLGALPPFVIASKRYANILFGRDDSPLSSMWLYQRAYYASIKLNRLLPNTLNQRIKQQWRTTISDVIGDAYSSSNQTLAQYADIAPYSEYFSANADNAISPSKSNKYPSNPTS